MPLATTGPGPIIDAPLAGTPLTDSNSRFESYCHRTSPFVVEYARSAPSLDPEKMTPGMSVTAADCATLQPRAVPHAAGGGAVYQTRSPVARLTACRPPGSGGRVSGNAK